jgi:hypothetical protein
VAAGLQMSDRSRLELESGVITADVDAHDCDRAS